MYPDLIFTAQSAALRVWASALDPHELSEPSSLPGWTVTELLAHLVAVHDAVAGLRPVQDGTDADVLTVADYVGGYSEDAERVARMAQAIARDTDGDPLTAWDAAAAQARQTLGALGAADRLITTRRGPMLLSAYLTTRVIELVVHADDLHRSLPQRPAPPVLPSAREHVFGALREVLTARDGEPAVLTAASELDQQDFVDLATGRPTGSEVADVPAALSELLPLL